VKVEVKLFAVAKQLAGQGSVTLDLPESVTIRELRAALAESVPQLADLLKHARFAVNAEYASDDTRLPPGAEVACIPPVSGG